MTRLVLSTLLIFTFLVPLLAAPVPRPCPPVPLQVVPGLYTLSWQGSLHEMLLDSDGQHSCRELGADDWTWEGSWQWDRQTRVLRVQRTADGGRSWTHWNATLDADLRGKAGYGATNVEVRVSLKKKVMFQ